MKDFAFLPESQLGLVAFQALEAFRLKSTGERAYPTARARGARFRESVKLLRLLHLIPHSAEVTFLGSAVSSTGELGIIVAWGTSGERNSAPGPVRGLESGGI